MSLNLRTCLRCVGRVRPVVQRPASSATFTRRTNWKIPGMVLVGAAGLLYAAKPLMFSKEDARFNKLKASIGCATMHLHQTESVKATPHFEEAMRIVGDELGKRKPEDPIPSERYVYLWDQLGNIALTLERYEEAAKLYQATVEGLALNNIPRSSRKITELFLKLGQIYAIISDYTQAELSFLHVVEVTTAELRKNGTGPKNRDVVHLNGLAFEGLGKMYVSMGQAENALHMYRYAVEFARSALGPNDAHIPVLLSDMAFTYQSTGRLEEAATAVEEAVQLSIKNNPMVYPTILCNKATITMERGELEDAQTLYAEALRIAQKQSDYSTVQEVGSNQVILQEKLAARQNET